MKHLILLLSLLGMTWWVNPALAQTLTTTPNHLIQEANLDTIKAKIRANETFYLFVGRQDNRDAQLALVQLSQVTQKTGVPITYLDIRGINNKAYKAFSKKYSIRSHSYLAKFSKRQQIAVYHNDWSTGTEQLISFLQP